MQNWEAFGTSGWSNCESLPAAPVSVSIIGSEVDNETDLSNNPEKNQ
mgnify:CR=1 FL=1